jgi:hypothetical protein
MQNESITSISCPQVLWKSPSQNRHLIVTPGRTPNWLIFDQVAKFFIAHDDAIGVGITPV